MILRKIILYIVVLIFAITTVYRLYQNYYIREILKDFYYGEAVLVEKKEGAVRSPKSGKFYFRIKNKKIYFNQSGDFLHYQIGDTFKIIYAKKDYNVAKALCKKGCVPLHIPRIPQQKCSNN